MPAPAVLKYQFNEIRFLGEYLFARITVQAAHNEDGCFAAAELTIPLDPKMSALPSDELKQKALTLARQAVNVDQLLALLPPEQ